MRPWVKLLVNAENIRITQINTKEKSYVKSRNCNGKRLRYADYGTGSRFFKENGFKVIIAGAGKAAHLPGMCASLVSLPVIGVPMKTSDLGGVDSLYSIVQMPSGIPCATVAINGGKNAGILAAKILAVSDSELEKKLEAYTEEMKNEVVHKAERLKEIGYEAYLKEMGKQIGGQYGLQECWS